MISSSLGHMLDDNALFPQLAAEQREADIVVVFVAVADERRWLPSCIASAIISSGLEPASRP